MVRKVVTVDEGLHLPVEVQDQLSDDLRDDFQGYVDTAALSATNAALSADAAAVSEANAEQAAAEAEEIVVGDADTVVSNLIEDTGSDTYIALDAGFATNAELQALQAQSASTEDLLFSTNIQLGPTSTWTNTGNVAVPLFNAPFACQITRVSMIMTNSAGNTALSDTNYWLVELRKWNSGNTVTTTLAQKSTKTTALASPGGPASNGVPAGTAITARVPWEFSSAILAGATFAAGDTLSWNTFPQGTPTAWSGAISVTVSYRPL